MGNRLHLIIIVQNTISNKQVAIVGLFSIGILLAALALAYLFTTNESSEQVSNEISSQGGVVASLDRNNTFADPRLQQQQNTPQVAAAQTPEPRPKNIEIVLPPTWSITGSSSEPNVCNPDTEATTSTYTSGSKTLVVIESTNTAVCEQQKIADAYLGYTFANEGLSISIANKSAAQCSKDQNPACPKGDGKVSITSSSILAADTTKLEPNPINNKTYVFSVTDSTISGTFDQQIAELATLLEAVSFR